jgi:Tol biopolymer transport system component
MTDIYVLPIDPETGAPAGKPRQIDYQPVGNNVSPIYSPDGKYIAFTLRDEGRYIVIYPVSGGEVRKYQVPSRNFRGAMYDVRWAPDGSRISFTGPATKETPGWQEGQDAFRFFTLDLKTGQWKTEALDGTAWGRSEWRGDGKGFYFSSRLGAGNWRVMEKDLMTGECKPFLEQENIVYRVFRCSRDYTKLAIQGNKPIIQVFDAKTGEKLKEFEGCALPVWSRDGRYLMVRQDRKPSYNILSYSDGSSTLHDLSEDLPNGNITGHDWSPLGNQMAFVLRYSQSDAYILRNVIPEE